jgi:hypothetical protein
MEKLFGNSVIVIVLVSVWLLADVGIFHSQAIKRDKSRNRQSLRLLLYRVFIISFVTSIIVGFMFWQSQMFEPNLLTNIIIVLFCLLIPVLGTLVLYYALLRKRNVI